MSLKMFLPDLTFLSDSWVSIIKIWLIHTIRVHFFISLWLYAMQFELTLNFDYIEIIDATVKNLKKKFNRIPIIMPISC